MSFDLNLDPCLDPCLDTEHEYAIPNAEDDSVMILKPLKPREKLARTTIRETLLAMLDGMTAEESEDCMRWAEANTRVTLDSRETPEVCQQFAGELKEKWRTWRDAWAPWKAKALVPFPEPLVDDDCITIRQLHTYLTELLSVHPDIAAIPVKHERCRFTSETTDVAFNPEELALIFS